MGEFGFLKRRGVCDGRKERARKGERTGKG